MFHGFGQFNPFTLRAVGELAYPGLASIVGLDPFTSPPWWLMTKMAPMVTVKDPNPVAVIVDAETNNTSVHTTTLGHWAMS